MLRIIIFLILLSNWSIAQEICPGCGFFAIHLESKELRASGHYDLPLIPASTWKVVTVLSALDKLGESAAFESELYIQGGVDQFGVLWGNVILKPDRDPTWASERIDHNNGSILTDLSQAIKSEGINCVAGSIIVDVSEMGTDVLAPTWPWEDIGNYYATGAWGLNYKDNTVRISFERGNVKPEIISVTPELPSVEWINELGYGKPGSGDQAYIHAAPEQKVRYIRGTLPEDMDKMTIKGALPNPMEVFLSEWGAMLEKIGVDYQALKVLRDTSHEFKDARLIKTLRTPLSQVAKVALEESDNLYTEAIFRKAFPGPSYKLSLKSFENYLEGRGWRTRPRDGAGLSMALSWSPLEAGQMLKAFLKKNPEFTNYLPPISKTSLGRYAPTIKNTRLKSGSMTDVTTYLGLWEEEWIFFVGHNGHLPKRDEVRREMVAWLEGLPLNRK